MSTIRETRAASRFDFGFDEIMGAAKFDRFPAWYADRCLLPNGAEKPPHPVVTAESAVEAYAFSKAA